MGTPPSFPHHVLEPIHKHARPLRRASPRLHGQQRVPAHALPHPHAHGCPHAHAHAHGCPHFCPSYFHGANVWRLRRRIRPPRSHDGRPSPAHGVPCTFSPLRLPGLCRVCCLRRWLVRVHARHGTLLQLRLFRPQLPLRRPSSPRLLCWWHLRLRRLLQVCCGLCMLPQVHPRMLCWRHLRLWRLLQVCCGLCMLPQVLCLLLHHLLLRRLVHLRPQLQLLRQIPFTHHTINPSIHPKK